MSILRQEGSSANIKIKDKLEVQDDTSLEVWLESTIQPESKQTILNSPDEQFLFTPTLPSEQLANQLRDNIQKEQRRFNQQCEMLKVRIHSLLNEYDDSRVKNS